MSLCNHEGNTVNMVVTSADGTVLYDAQKYDYEDGMLSASVIGAGNGNLIVNPTFNGTNGWERVFVSFEIEQSGNYTYTYDAWGALVSVTGTLASTIGEINPYRYRSYYYDTEIGFYYLQSRYYDPTVERFINEDLAILAINKLQDHNLFAYCSNNPIIYVDPTGYTKTLIFYDARTSGYLWGLICGIGFAKQAGVWIETLERLGHYVKAFPFESIPEFVKAWNSVNEKFEEIIILAHGAPFSLDCGGTRLLSDYGTSNGFSSQYGSKVLKKHQ